MIEQPNSLSSIKQVAIVIGLVHCESESSCPGPTNELGTILYSGSFNPQYATPPGTLPPHQNFSLQVPETFAVGYAQLGVAHMYLLGAGLSPYLETFNTTLMITNTSTAADSQGATKTFSGMRIVGKPRLRQ
ncbi:hypothetical protein BT96DRAFT_33287 [Gymnopus androsaceus JB14]|uniref:Uncharacterized protein n=1 Tax=Gymnopus androsaceus JB14 TaxID=1447944 RepID=A0A6A4HI91_9AGAR|nr:hypothetical protein BT96DRAFT_33287 [Gymnopus androsaceus JB14]